MSTLGDYIQKYEDCSEVWKTGATKTCEQWTGTTGTNPGDMTYNAWNEKYKEQLAVESDKYNDLVQKIKTGVPAGGKEPKDIKSKRMEAERYEKMLQNKFGISDGLYDKGLAWASLFVGSMAVAFYFSSKN
tara:strand:- start:5751 stop:6143 length:393 start_codon:yes stop_codon:yes gene_type:complete